MDILQLRESIKEALILLIKQDMELIENQPKEECINHRFAQYLEEELVNKGLLKCGMTVDVEYDKYKEGPKPSPEGDKIRPDIIAHKRKSGNKNNLIVIEAKKLYLNKKDKKKIKDLVND